eukprot:scaffold4433_cov124-Isochrysis_galbana.AAC.4
MPQTEVKFCHPYMVLLRLAELVRVAGFPAPVGRGPWAAETARAPREGAREEEDCIVCVVGQGPAGAGGLAVTLRSGDEDGGARMHPSSFAPRLAIGVTPPDPRGCSPAQTEVR